MQIPLLLLLFKLGGENVVVVTNHVYPVIEGQPTSYLVIHGSPVYSTIEGNDNSYVTVKGN